MADSSQLLLDRQPAGSEGAGCEMEGPLGDAPFLRLPEMHPDQTRFRSLADRR